MCIYIYTYLYILRCICLDTFINVDIYIHQFIHIYIYMGDVLVKVDGASVREGPSVREPVGPVRQVLSPTPRTPKQKRGRLSAQKGPLRQVLDGLALPWDPWSVVCY